MRGDSPSLTASVVSFARGVVSRSEQSPCYDPIAVDLVPAPFRWVLKAMNGGPRPLLERLVRAAFFGLISHIELRTALIDEALRAAISEGAQQLVLLGAGLDARAWRLPELSALDVYEVDHPSTQAFKRRRIAGRAPLARSVHFAPVDFTRSSLEEGLAATPFKPALRTFWIWEGVTPYLAPQAIDATLQAVARLSAPGSRLAVTYLTPDSVPLAVARPLALVGLLALGEPLLGRMSSATLEEHLRAAGFERLFDELPAHAGPRFGRSGRRGLLEPSERVAIAQR